MATKQMDFENISAISTAIVVWLTGFLVLTLGLAVEQYAFPDWNHHTAASIASQFALLVALGFLTLFYVTLGLLAKSLGKSWITWVGLSLISTPLGALVAYGLLRKHANQILTRRGA